MLLKQSLTTLAAAIVAVSSLSSASAQENTAYIAEPYTVSVADDLAARQVIARLNHALDAADYPLYASFFAEDGVFESDFGDAVGPEQVAAALEQVRPFITNRRHVAANHVINRDGDQLVVTTYLIVFERVAALEYVGSAVNVDTLEQRDGQWKVVRHASTLDPATRVFIEEMMKAGDQ
ncbi:nuclear transport factor 2 family protein [Tabrizicola sp.]|uniref:nuclear transport factor 2 family protein n=1 Tax=Tabrizicola sp. TaxID=2005166 RepID=UPI003F2A79F6